RRVHRRRPRPDRRRVAARLPRGRREGAAPSAPGLSHERTRAASVRPVHRCAGVLRWGRPPGRVSGASSWEGAMNVARLKIPTIVIAVVALVVGVSSGAVAAKLITGKDIKDNTVTSADIKNGTLVTKDLKQNAINGNRLKKGTVNGAKLQGGTVAGAKLKPGSVGNGKLADGAVTSNKIPDGTIGPNDRSTTSFGPNWSIVDRNVIGNGDSYLRAGPSFQLGTQLSQPPLGVGSLGSRTGSGNDKAAFGDQVDFSGDPFTSAAITT